MGKPHPPGKYTALEIRKLIVSKHQEGNSIRQISKLLGVPRSTVGDIVKKFKEDGTVEYKKPPGRPRKTTEAADRRIVREVKRNPFTSTK